MKYHDAIKRVSGEYLADAVRFINIAANQDDQNAPKKASALKLATDRIQAVIALLKGGDE
jgi:hypothetical protein